jgi:predicted PurR-regulated permease PerM
MKKGLALTLLFVLLVSGIGNAVETAPRITDREIVERLSRLEEGQRSLEARIDALDRSLNKRIDEMDTRLNKRIDDLRSEMNARFEGMNARFDTLQWTLGLFITIALVILGFVLRLQWQMHRRLTRLETIQEKQGRDLDFVKSLIEKLLPPKGVL